MFRPSPAPAVTGEENSALADWAMSEFEALAAALQSTSVLKLDIVHVEPTKPRDGMVVYADGTDWDPGSGEGPYARVAGSWVKLFP